MSTNNYSLGTNNNNDNFCKQIAGGFRDPKYCELDSTSIFFSAAPGLLNCPDLGLILAGTSLHVVREELANMWNPASRHLTSTTFRLPSHPSLDFYRSTCSKPEAESSVDDRDQQCPTSGSSETRGVNLSRTTRPSPLTFSIERIMKPDFGARRNNISDSVCRNIEEQPSTIGGSSQRRPAAANSGCQLTQCASRQQEQEQEISSSSNSNFSWTVESDDFPHQQSSSGSSSQSTGSISSSRLVSVNLSASLSDDRSYHARTAGSGNTSPAAAAAADPRLPAWIYCTRYSDRPCAGRRTRKKKTQQQPQQQQRRRPTAERPRTRTAFHSGQLEQLTAEFDACRYLTDERRLRLATQLDLHESQIKVWFQNRRAKLKKARRAFHSGN